MADYRRTFCSLDMQRDPRIFDQWWEQFRGPPHPTIALTHDLALDAYHVRVVYDSAAWTGRGDG